MQQLQHQQLQQQQLLLQAKQAQVREKSCIPPLKAPYMTPDRDLLTNKNYCAQVPGAAGLSAVGGLGMGGIGALGGLPSSGIGSLASSIQQAQHAHLMKMGLIPGVRWCWSAGGSLGFRV